MRKKARLSKQAGADLDDIWLYVAQDSIRRADRLISKLYDKCQLLASSPGLGRRRDELRPSLRSFPSGRHVIFYRTSSTGIEIVRILDGHRDIDRIFRTETGDDDD